jgi:hypothetical protein
LSDDVSLLASLAPASEALAEPFEMVDPPEVVVVEVLVVSSLVTGSWTSFFLMQLVPFQLLPDGHERHDPLYMKNP